MIPLLVAIPSIRPLLEMLLMLRVKVRLRMMLVLVHMLRRPGVPLGIAHTAAKGIRVIRGIGRELLGHAVGGVVWRDDGGRLGHGVCRARGLCGVAVVVAVCRRVASVGWLVVWIARVAIVHAVLAVAAVAVLHRRGSRPCAAHGYRRIGGVRGGGRGIVRRGVAVVGGGRMVGGGRVGEGVVDARERHRGDRRAVVREGGGHAAAGGGEISC